MATTKIDRFIQRCVGYLFIFFFDSSQLTRRSAEKEIGVDLASRRGNAAPTFIEKNNRFTHTHTLTHWKIWKRQKKKERTNKESEPS